jgi:hypothetical protein
MSDRECDVCGQKTPAFICWKDTKELRKALVSAVWLDSQRAEAVRRGRAPGRHQAPTSVVPVTKRGIETAQKLHDCLVGWVRMLCEDKGVTYPGNNETTQLGAWLAHNVASIQYSEFAAEAYGDITDAVANLRRCIDIPEQWQPLGQCKKGADETTHEDGCEGYVYYAKGKPEAKCRDCGERYDVEDRKAWLIVSLGAWPLTATQIEQLPPLVDERKIKAATVRKWASRGRLFALDEDVYGDARYKLNDVIALHAQALARVKG